MQRYVCFFKQKKKNEKCSRVDSITFQSLRLFAKTLGVFAIKSKSCRYIVWEFDMFVRLKDYDMSASKEAMTFSYDVKLTYNFLRPIMQQGDQVEVLKPKTLCVQMRNHAQTLTSYND